MKNIINKKVDIRAVAASGVAMFGAVVLAFQMPVLAANTFPQVYELISINNVDGAGLNQDASIAYGHVKTVSYDGSKVVFETSATNLVDSGTGNKKGYLRDISLGVTERVDKSQNGTVADGVSDSYTMSETGRFVAFRSNATNLIDGTTYSADYRMYIRDFQTNEVQVINPVVDNTDPNYSSSRPNSISNDGRFIVVNTLSVDKFVPGTRSSSGHQDVVLLDRSKNQWTLLNKPVNGVMQNIPTGVTTSSCDGSLVLLSSYATNLTTDIVPANTANSFLVDIRNGITISYLTPGATKGSTPVSISCNGRYIIYNTGDRTTISPTPSGLVPSTQVVRYDRLTGERKYVSSKSDGSFSDLGARGMAVTDKGDVVMSVHKYSDGLPHFAIGMKHLSDGSGTLEDVQHIHPGLLYTNGTYAVASSDGRYVVAASRDSSVLGIPGSTNSNGQPRVNIIRIKTGL